MFLLGHTPDETKGFFSRMLILPMDKKTIEEGQADRGRLIEWQFP